MFHHVHRSLDFIVSTPQRITWLVDVKGRRFPSGDVQKQYWKNWSTRDDLRSLAEWERLFGESFCGLFVFAYNILGHRAPLPEEALFEFREKRYGFVAVRLSDYAAFAPSDFDQLGHVGDVGGRLSPPGPAAGRTAGAERMKDEGGWMKDRLLHPSAFQAGRGSGTGTKPTSRASGPQSVSNGTVMGVTSEGNRTL